jgi:hypothetical protein
MFYFRATKSFHVNRRPGAGSRAAPAAPLPAAPRSPRLSRHRADGIAPMTRRRYAAAGRLRDNRRDDRRAGLGRRAISCRGGLNGNVFLTCVILLASGSLKLPMVCAGNGRYDLTAGAGQ